MSRQDVIVDAPVHLCVPLAFLITGCVDVSKNRHVDGRSLPAALLGNVTSANSAYCMYDDDAGYDSPKLVCEES